MATYRLQRWSSRSAHQSNRHGQSLLAKLAFVHAGLPPCDSLSEPTHTHQCHKVVKIVIVVTMHNASISSYPPTPVDLCRHTALLRPLPCSGCIPLLPQILTPQIFTSPASLSETARSDQRFMIVLSRPITPFRLTLPCPWPRSSCGTARLLSASRPPLPLPFTEAGASLMAGMR
jgi:hypothetical protein